MKDIKIKKFRPQFTSVITTLDTYEEDLIIDGIVRAPKGWLKMYQRVVAVGPNVRDIKEGDLVLINLQNYIKRSWKDGSLKDGIEKMEEEKVYDFPRIVINDTLYAKLQDRDIDGVIDEFEEYEVLGTKNSLLD